VLLIVVSRHIQLISIHIYIYVQIGAFFMINLCLVVIATQFAETKRRETERMLAERARMRSSSSMCMHKDDDY
jgi:voltage-dependent calcium channel T type alpha-1G